jgi:hypothetical protein
MRKEKGKEIMPSGKVLTEERESNLEGKERGNDGGDLKITEEKGDDRRIWRTSGFWPRVRCAHPTFWAHKHAKRGAARPPPIPASLLPPPKTKYSRNKMLPFWPELGPPGAYIFPLG